MDRVEQVCIDISFPAFRAEAPTLIHAPHFIILIVASIFDHLAILLMKQQDSGSFQLISIQQLNALELSASESPTPVQESNFLAYPSLQYDTAERQPTLEISLPNEFQSQFMQPLRKQSTNLEGWLQEDEQKSVEEVTPQQLVEEEEQSFSSLSSQECNLLSTSINFNTSIFTDRRNHNYQNNEQKCHKKQPTYRPTTDIDKKEPVKAVIKPSPIIVIQKQGYFYWFQDFTVEVNLTTLSMLYDEMFSRECFIPIFSQKIYTDWAALTLKERLAVDCYPHKILRGYLERYTDFMNQEHIFQSFSTVLSKLKDINEHSVGQNRYSPAASLMSFDVNSLVQGFKKMLTTRKSEQLRKTLLCKIISLQSARKNCQLFNLNRQSKRLKEAQSYYWKIFADIDLLQSLQATDEYCSKRCEKATQSKIRQFWIKYRTSIRQSIKSLYAATLKSVQI